MYTGCWSPLGIKYRARSLVQLSGKKQQPSTIGTSLGASVSDTSVWHLMQLEAAKILRLGRSGERVNVLACRIWSLRLLKEVAHGHVFDHAPAQRADGLRAHRGALVLRWRSPHRRANPATPSLSRHWPMTMTRPFGASPSTAVTSTAVTLPSGPRISVRRVQVVPATCEGYFLTA